MCVENILCFFKNRVRSTEVFFVAGLLVQLAAKQLMILCAVHLCICQVLEECTVFTCRLQKSYCGNLRIWNMVFMSFW